MKKCCQVLCLLTIILAVSYCVSFSQTTTFYYTGAIQMWTVPAGVNAVFVDVQGAQGGVAGPAGDLGVTTPGCGGRVQANLAVTPGQVYNINVGGSGLAGYGYTTTPGGYNGGGLTQSWAPAAPSYNGGSGGGKTDISLTGTELIIAGGGGGAGYNGGCALSGQPGGNGGGLIGDSSTTCDATLRGLGFTTIRHAGGGTQTAGGAGAYVCCGGYYAGTAGSPGTGGDNVDSGGVGGGGGGGYYGGGGGCWSGGGGGSSYTNPSFVTSVTHTQGFNCSDGTVIICVLPDPGTITGGGSGLCGLGATTVLSATGVGGGTWSSSNAAIASVEASGLVTAIAAGAVAMSYTVSNGCGTIAATTTVNVITAGTITGKDSVCLGYTITLADTTAGGVWSSFNTVLATIGSGTGVVTGVALGTDTMYYTVNTAGCTVKAKVPMKVKSHTGCVLGISTIAADEPLIKVVPNPGPGVFTVTLSSDIDEDAHFMVTNMVGEKISEVTGTTNKALTMRLDVPAGVYFLSAATIHGKWTEKVMVVR